MVRDRLDVSRIDAHRLALQGREVDLAGLVRDVIQRAPELAKRTAVVSSAEAPERLLVWADAARIEQVVGTSLSNATRYGEPSAGIDLELVPADSYVEVTVTNRGPGTGAGDLAGALERFGRGATGGLGLYIARGLVEAHGGTISAESTAGQATAFRFTLPRTRPDPQPPDARGTAT